MSSSLTAGFALVNASRLSFDTSMAQKSHFKMQLDGNHNPRKTFPQLPWNTVKNPKYIDCANGGKLLISGWWAYLRKPVSLCSSCLIPLTLANVYNCRIMQLTVFKSSHGQHALASLHRSCIGEHRGNL